MKFFNYTKPKMIVADENKYIRQKDEVYKESFILQNGQEIPEHFPHYATVIFVPDSFTEEQMKENYIEEDMEG